VGFEPTVPFSTHAFQACALSRSAISPDNFCCSPPKSGGEGGIRTLDGLPHTPLAGERLQPLGHLSGPRKIPSFTGSWEEPAKADFQPMEWRAAPIGPRVPALIWREALASNCPKVAEREGFEPSRGLHPWRFSRPLPSTARPPLRTTKSDT
jgi:hypothetical protein